MPAENPMSATTTPHDTRRTVIPSRISASAIAPTATLTASRR
jgi:hypothetical protein